MAKRRRGTTGPRVIHNISNQRLRDFIVLTPRPPRLTFLQEIEDRRQYHPMGVTRPARMLSGPSHRLGLPQRAQSVKSRSWLPTAVSFKTPKKVAICVRRKTRKEVLFAKGKSGRGNRRGRKSFYSEIHC